MLSQRLSLSISLLGLSGLTIAAACSSKSGSATSSSASSTTSANNTSASGSNASTSSGSGVSSGGTGCSSNGLLIDDMSDLTGAQIRYPAPAGDVSGYWFSYNCANGCQSTACPSLEQTPAQFSKFFYTPVGTPGDAGFTVAAAPGDAGDLDHAACTWGTIGSGRYPFVAEGFNFATNPPSAQDAADGAPPTPVSVDISCHTGIQFWAYADPTAGAQTVTLMLADQNSSAYGGVCNPNSVCPDASATACGPYQFNLDFTPGWSFQQVPFATLALNQYWGLQDAALDLPQAFSVFFQEETQSAEASTEPFGFCIADISFY